MPNRALIYTRVSSDSQEIDGTSLATQRAACERYAADHGYEVLGTFSDTYTGSLYRERPGLSTLRETLSAGGIDVVLCYALDRLSRNQAHVAILVEEIVDAGARLELVTEDFEDSAVGRFILSARAFVAEVEREKIAERTSRGRRARAEAGKIMPGPKPLYGYRWNADNTALVIEPADAAVVRRIFRDFVAGASLRAIARQLTADGIATPAGRDSWWPSTVQRILRNEHYTGDAYALRWRSFQAPGVTVHTAGRRVTRRKPAGDDAVRLPPGTVPAIIDRETFDAAARQLEHNRAHATRNNRDPESSLLRAGFAWCALCETPMHVSNTTNPPHGQYRCRFPWKPERLHNMAISRSMLDDAVWERVRQFMLEDVLIEEIAGQPDDDQPDVAMREIETLLRGLDRQRDNLVRTVAQTDDPDAAAALLTQLEQLTARRRTLTAERDALHAAAADRASTRRARDDFNTWRATIAANIDQMDYQQRRQLLSQLGLRVHVWPAGEREPRWEISSTIFPAFVFHSSARAPHPYRLGG